MKSVILGNGQIGTAVAEVVNRTDESIIVDSTPGVEAPIVQAVSILHVCFPFTNEEQFLDSVNYYVEKYQTHRVIIWSTLPIGTTKKISGAIHSPVEGRHPKLSPSIRSMTRWFGYNDDVSAKFFTDYFQGLGLNVKAVPSSDFTEALKLLSTTEFGVNVEFARYKKKVADNIGMDFDLTKQWNKDYNKLYHNIGMDWAQKFVLEAPQGPKGGHCVTPNARILQEQYPDELVKIVGELE